jgi:hypothetical protein
VTRDKRKSSGHQLTRYDAACRALAVVRSVDEVKDIRDRAVAMAAYARQAKNRDLEADAVEIRMRATRRLDQLRQAQKETVGLATGGDEAQPNFCHGRNQRPGHSLPALRRRRTSARPAGHARWIRSWSRSSYWPKPSQ